MAQDQILIDTVIASWKLWTGRMEKGVAQMPDEKFETEIAPGKNRIRYIVGHVAAVNDMMLPALRLGVRLHPELDAAFLSNPDRTLPDTVSAAELRQALVTVNAALTLGLENMPAEQWFGRHMLVSEEDFAKEPTRNKLALVLSRTSHVAMHLGQLALVR